MRKGIRLIAVVIIFSFVSIWFEVSGDEQLISKDVVINNVTHAIIFFMSRYLIEGVMKYLKYFSLNIWLHTLFSSLCIVGVYWGALFTDDLLNRIFMVDIFNWNIIYLLAVGGALLFDQCFKFLNKV